MIGRYGYLPYGATGRYGYLPYITAFIYLG